MSLKASMEPVRGLVDAERAAVILGVPARRLTTWQAKKMAALRSGNTPGGVLAALPDPAGYLNGAPVWHVAEIVAMKEKAAGSIGSVGRPHKSHPEVVSP